MSHDRLSQETDASCGMAKVWFLASVLEFSSTCVKQFPFNGCIQRTWWHHCTDTVKQIVLNECLPAMVWLHSCVFRVSDLTMYPWHSKWHHLQQIILNENIYQLQTWYPPKIDQHAVNYYWIFHFQNWKPTSPVESNYWTIQQQKIYKKIIWKLF